MPGGARDSFDAEDAFQATFLVLARKAGSAWVEGQLGGWLHRVAYRIAVRASMDRARRRRHERQAAEVAAMGHSQGRFDHELQPALHEELARLPGKLRLPVVLCYLEGLTHAQAAMELSCGEATIRRRLTGARQRLRRRLVRRGFAPSASATVLSIAAGQAGAVPPAVAEATLRAAVRVAAGEAVAVVAGGRLAGLVHAGSMVMTGSSNATAMVVLSIVAIASLATGIGAGLTAPPKLKARAAFAAKTQPLPEAEPRTVTQAPAVTGSAQKHEITGMVYGPDGKPMAGAELFWLGQPPFERSRMARPRGFKEKPEEGPRKLAKCSTDAGGRFVLAAAFDAKALPGRMVIVKAKRKRALGTDLFQRDGARERRQGPEADISSPIAGDDRGKALDSGRHARGGREGAAGRISRRRARARR